MHNLALTRQQMAIVKRAECASMSNANDDAMW